MPSRRQDCMSNLGHVPSINLENVLTSDLICSLIYWYNINEESEPDGDPIEDLADQDTTVADYTTNDADAAEMHTEEINDRKAAEFGGTDAYWMKSPDPATEFNCTAMTHFMIVRPTGEAFDDHLLYRMDPALEFDKDGDFWIHVAASAISLKGRWDGSTVEHEFNYNWPNEILSYDWKVLTTEWDGENVRMFINKTQIGEDSPQTGDFDSAVKWMKIGGNDVAGEGLEGFIAEAFGFADDIPTEFVRDCLIQGLMDKYSIT